MEGIRRVFAVITNGYSDAKLTTDQDVVEAVFTMTASDDVDTVFVAREDSSVSNQRGTHTNTELWIQMLSFVIFGKSKVPDVLSKVADGNSVRHRAFSSPPFWKFLIFEKF